MSETTPTVAELLTICETTLDSGLVIPAIDDEPAYEGDLLLLWLLDKITAATSAALRVFKDGDLTFGVMAGRYLNGDTAVNYAGASEHLTPGQCPKIADPLEPLSGTDG